MAEEKSRAQQDKKEQQEQIKGLKAEMKSLNDKIDRCCVQWRELRLSIS